MNCTVYPSKPNPVKSIAKHIPEVSCDIIVRRLDNPDYNLDKLNFL